jgi:Carboxypeptidase regulatory-like domain
VNGGRRRERYDEDEDRMQAFRAALVVLLILAAATGSGQYTVVNLPLGTYSVTFSLPGFNTVRLEGIEVEANVTTNVNEELKVGADAAAVVSSAIPDRGLRPDGGAGRCEDRSEDAAPSARQRAEAEHQDRSGAGVPEIKRKA